ncbi:MAG: NAD-dependent epimerase/dehydratase family protein [bacterium]|nr:NAD-dependent epimerase/dehydratase family protein [bacterium]
MKILVCGASGFIGRNIAAKLSKKHNVVGVYNVREPWSGIKWIKADLTKKEEVNEVIKNFDVVIQAAATTSGSKDIVTKPYIHTTDNVIMNSLIFRRAFESKVKHVIFFSCSVMYPSSSRPLKEEDFTGEIHPKYFGVGWTKVYIEKMAEFYSKLGNTKFTVIRHSNIYGPYDKFDLEKSHFFAATITKVMNAKELDEIVVWGRGIEERDLLYVDDLVDFVEKVFNQNNKFELVNVGYGKSYSVNEVVDMIIKASGKRLKIIHDLSKPSIETKVALDITKAKKIFKWEPKTTIKEGIKKTINWYRKNIIKNE